MKKIFVMALAAAALAVTSCGGNSKSADAPADSTAVEAADSTTATAAEGTTTSAEQEIAALSQVLEGKDVSKVKTTLETVTAKISELAKTDPKAAQAYVEQLQGWLKANADKVKEATGNDATVSTVISSLTSTSSATLVDGYSKAKAAVESVTGTVSETATKAADAVGKANDAAEKVNDAVSKAKSITKEKVNEEANKAVDNAKETAKSKAKEEAGKAVEKGLKSLGL